VRKTRIKPYSRAQSHPCTPRRALDRTRSQAAEAAGEDNPFGMSGPPDLCPFVPFASRSNTRRGCAIPLPWRRPITVSSRPQTLHRPSSSWSIIRSNVSTRPAPSSRPGKSFSKSPESVSLGERSTGSVRGAKMSCPGKSNRCSGARAR